MCCLCWTKYNADLDFPLGLFQACKCCDSVVQGPTNVPHGVIPNALYRVGLVLRLSIGRCGRTFVGQSFMAWFEMWPSSYQQRGKDLANEV